MDQHEIVREAGDFNQSFMSLKEREMCYDVEVLFNNERISLHSLILGGNSRFFEFNLCNMPLVPRSIVLENMNTEAAKTIFEYCYAGKMKVQRKDVVNVLKVAQYLMIKSAIKSCCDVLKLTLDSTNCFEIWKLARSLHLDDLENSAFDWIRKSFNEVTKELLALDLNDLIKLLDHDSIVGAQEKLFELIKQWIKHNRAVRSKDLIRLLGFVKLEELSVNILAADFKDLCVDDPQCYILFVNALVKQSNKESLNRCQRSLIVVGGWSTPESKIVEIYDGESKNWIKRELDLNTMQFSCVFCDDKLYVIGGRTKEPINTMECYDVKTWKKSTLPSMHEVRDNFSSVVVGEYIYVIGGRGKGIVSLSSVERFNPRSNRWTKVNSMPTARQHLGSAAIDDAIYAIGGYNGSSLSVNERFMISTGEWKSCKPMKEKRNGFGVAACGGFVYAVGGYGSVDLSSVERYDPKADSWTNVKMLSSPRRGVAAASYCNILYISGGYSSSSVVSTVEQYDPDKDQWMPLESLNVSRGYHNMIAARKLL